MKDQDKTKEQLVSELDKMRQQLAELEALETERKRMEESLRKSEEKYRTLVEGLEDIIVSFALDGTILYCSPNVNNFGGYDSKEEIGHHFSKYIADEEAKQELQEFFQGIIKERKTITFEFLYMPKSKDPFYVEAKANPIINEKTGELVSIQCIVRDITGRKQMKEELSKFRQHLEELVEERTVQLKEVVNQLQGEITERKQAEEALRESEERYRAIIDLGAKVGEAIVMLQDTEKIIGRYVFVSDEWTHITGYSREELLGMSQADLIHPRYRAEAVERHQRRMRGETISGLFEISIIRKDGAEVPIELTGAYTTYQGMPAHVVYMRDITERRQAEDALRESEEFNSSVLRNAPNPVLVANSDTSIRYVNPALEKLTGYSLDELVGQKMPRPWWPEEMLEKAMHEAELAYRHGYENVEQLLKKKNGERFWVEITAKPVIIDGKLHHFIANWADITERKQAEEELIRNRDYLERLNDSLTDMVFEIKFPERTILYINKAVETVLGYSREECIGQCIEMLYPSHEAFREVGGRLRKGIERGDEITTSEHELKRKDGGIITVEGRTSYFREDGKVVSALSVVRDITERKRAEEALADEATRRRILVEQSRDGIVILEQNGKVFEANHRFSQMLGYSPEETLKLHVWDWDTQWAKEQLLEMIGSVDAAGDHFETYHRRKDGTIYDVEISTNGAIIAGQKLVFCVCRDITERKQAEEERQKFEKLESIGTLAGGIAHDFNNILTGIMGNIGLAKRHVEPDGKVFERLEEAEKASMRARDLTQQLLTFSRGGAPVKKTVSIAELLEDSAIFALRGSKVKCEFSLPDDLWPVEIDEGQLHQVITNLAINADEAMTQGGLLQVGAKNTVIKRSGALPLAKGNYVEITLKERASA